MKPEDRDLIMYGASFTLDGKRIDPRDVFVKVAWWKRLWWWLCEHFSKGNGNG